jgi:predicted component of type VI protein secretion system
VEHGFILDLYELDLSPLGQRRAQLPIRIGRSSLNDVAVSHRLVSEFHARIEEVDGKVCVRDLSSKNGVFVETVESESATRIEPQRPVDLDPYGFEFLLSPLLRVRLRPAAPDEVDMRQSQARGSVLGNASLLVSPGAPLAEDELTDFFAPERPLVAAPIAVRPAAPTPSTRAAPPRPALDHPAPSPAAAPPASRRAPQPAPPSPAVQAYASVFIEHGAGPLKLPPVVASPGQALGQAQPALGSDGRRQHAPARSSTVVEQGARFEDMQPQLTRTAWEVPAPATPARGVVPAPAPVEPSPARSLEGLALQGLRELAASLLPGQSIQDAADLVRLITKLHDALEMFCRCFIPVREACSRFIPAPDLEHAAIERSRYRSSAYLAIERALEPRAVAAALLDWRNAAEDAPVAIENILADLMLHHLALSQGVIEGTHTLLEELSPAQIEANAGQTTNLLSRLGLAAKERGLWEAYEQRHAAFDTPGPAFEDVFGGEFARAYAARWGQRGGGGTSTG